MHTFAFNIKNALSTSEVTAQEDFIQNLGSFLENDIWPDRKLPVIWKSLCTTCSFRMPTINIWFQWKVKSGLQTGVLFGLKVNKIWIFKIWFYSIHSQDLPDILASWVLFPLHHLRVMLRESKTYPVCLAYLSPTKKQYHIKRGSKNTIICGVSLQYAKDSSWMERICRGVCV